MAIGIQAPAAPHIINAEVPTAEMLTYGTLLERFSNTYVLTDSIEGGFFLRKKPLCGVVSVYSNWRTAITAPRRVHRGQLDGRGGSAARPLDCRQDCPKNRTHCPFLGLASKFLQIFILCIILTMDQNSSNLCIFSKKQLFFALW